MAVKDPGVVGGRRVNRYAGSEGNRADRRHKLVNGTGIDFDTVPVPDEIGDTGNGLAVFEVDESIRVEGSTSNDGAYTVQTVAAGALGVDEALPLTEVAGDDVSINSRNNRRDSAFS